MLARKCHYPLQSDASCYVEITIEPCCTIEIAVPKKSQCIRSKLALIHFTPNEQCILLECYAADSIGPKSVQLDLSYGDALELCQMIDEVQEEHERLMSDLCY
ncbi:hypothetical protein GCM10011502_04540 [Oceanisphaera marina]|uniref:Uncharacterized protein n=1 Tax=Oceanisphaera marina TaxID=2017550 RepID=A0ABQ1IDB9_9GAMM|nr:hypothetical protein GCM10011502_04540 [Oceanisphaera marina]